MSAYVGSSKNLKDLKDLISVGPQTVTSGGPVTVTGNEPLLPLPKKSYAQPCRHDTVF